MKRVVRMLVLVVIVVVLVSEMTPLFAAPAAERATAGNAANVAGFATAVQTYRFVVWADSLIMGVYGRHEVGFAADSYQRALEQLSLYEHAWGQRLESENKHYNSIESRFIRLQ